MNPPTDLSSRPLPAALRLFGLTYALSWGFWIPAALTGQSHMEFPTVLLYTLGGFGPSLAGIWMVRRTLSPAERADFWRRVWDPRRISASAWAVIWLLIPGVFVLGILLTFLSGQDGAGFTGLRLIMASPIQLLPSLLIGIIGGPLAEELGWRGYALDRLQSRLSPLAASLVLAAAWALWHLPLFFIRGTVQSQLGVGTIMFWNFLLTAIPLTVMMTWLYNRSRRSILAAILAHFTFNMILSLAFPLSLRADTYKTVLFVIAGAAFGMLLGPRPAAASEDKVSALP